MAKVLTRQDLKAEKGIPYSREQLRRKIRDGEFPAPFNPPGSSLNLWLENVIDAYLEACAAGRDWRTETSNPSEAA